MGAYGAAGVLLLTGWSMLQPEAAWAYIAAFVAFEAWLARRIAATGSAAVMPGEPPYGFTPDEAQLVGRYRFYFTYPGLARECACVLAALGLSALVLAPWLTYQQLFVPAAAVGANLLVVARLTLRAAPLTALRRSAARGSAEALRMLHCHDPAWDKIRAGNASR